VLTQWRVLANKRISQKGSAYLGEIWASVYYLWCNISNDCLIFSIYWGYRWHWPLAAVNQAECGHSGRMNGWLLTAHFASSPTDTAGRWLCKRKREVAIIHRHNNQIHLADHFIWRHHPFPRSFLPPFLQSLISPALSWPFSKSYLPADLGHRLFQNLPSFKWNWTWLIQKKNENWNVPAPATSDLIIQQWKATDSFSFRLLCSGSPVTSGARKWNE